MAIILHMVTQKRLCIDVTVNHTEHKAFIFGMKMLPLSFSGVALEHIAALMGIAVQPLARSNSIKENMKSVV